MTVAWARYLVYEIIDDDGTERVHKLKSGKDARDLYRALKSQGKTSRPITDLHKILVRLPL